MPSLNDINTMPATRLVALLGGIFEHSPWVAQNAALARPFATVDALHAAMVDTVKSAAAGTQLALLRAHPDLAGKEAKAGLLSNASAAEQKSAALDQLSPQEMQTIAANNAAYGARFGFPFIICVRNHDKDGIFSAFARRLQNEPAVEFASALDEVYQIARLRLAALIDD